MVNKDPSIMLLLPEPVQWAPLLRPLDSVSCAILPPYLAH